MPDPELMIARQRMLAEFGDLAMRSDRLDEILSEACRVVAAALGTDRAKVLEIRDDGTSLLLCAGVGWLPGVVGGMRIPMNERSSESYSIKVGVPVVTRDIRTEERFDLPDFMVEAGVVALVNVPIRLPGGAPYGLLQVDANEPRDFAVEDTEFLLTFATILGPVIDRLRKVDELSKTEERFRAIVENAVDYAIFTTDWEGHVTDWLAGAQAVFGWSADEIKGKSCAILYTAEDRADGLDRMELDNARRDGSALNVRWHLRKDGSRVFINGTVKALRGETEGEIRGFIRIGQDVTEAKRQALRMEVLVNELQHRCRNLLGVVTAIANRTLTEGGSVEDYLVRLKALGRAQALLSRAGTDTVEVGELVRAELDAHVAVTAPKVVVSGPAVTLTSHQVQNFALAVHELATNAVKYGALKAESGRLSVTWVVAEKDAKRALQLSWRESGVRVQDGAGSRRGYGRELIENALSYALGARTSFELGADGVRCEIELPLV